MKFEWDDLKARRNAAKHGISFITASFAVNDPHSIIEYDSKHSTHESRYWLIGDSGEGILVVVFTVRPGNIIRIISAWRAGQEERRDYEKTKI